MSRSGHASSNPDSNNSFQTFFKILPCFIPILFLSLILFYLSLSPLSAPQYCRLVDDLHLPVFLLCFYGFLCLICLNFRCGLGPGFVWDILSTTTPRLARFWATRTPIPVQLHHNPSGTQKNVDTRTRDWVLGGLGEERAMRQASARRWQGKGQNYFWSSMFMSIQTMFHNYP